MEQPNTPDLKRRPIWPFGLAISILAVGALIALLSTGILNVSFGSITSPTATQQSERLTVQQLPPTPQPVSPVQKPEAYVPPPGMVWDDISFPTFEEYRLY